MEDGTSSAVITQVIKITQSSISATLSASDQQNYIEYIIRYIKIFAAFFIGTVLLYLNGIVNLQQLIQAFISLSSSIKNWWTKKIPSQRVLGPLSNNSNKVLIFVRDLYLQAGTTLIARDGVNGAIGYVPNIGEVWPRVESFGLSKLLNVLGQNDKTTNIDIIEMSKDIGLWNENLIILGAQAQKCLDFYQKMKYVAFRMSATDIIVNKTGKVIKREAGFGYGIILKCKNPLVKEQNGYGFLLGGFGVLGTEAACYYFAENLSELGKIFNDRCFGIVVRASITAGVQSTERVKKYDTKFDE